MKWSWADEKTLYCTKPETKKDENKKLFILSQSIKDLFLLNRLLNVQFEEGNHGDF